MCEDLTTPAAPEPAPSGDYGDRLAADWASFARYEVFVTYTVTPLGHRRACRHVLATGLPFKQAQAVRDEFYRRSLDAYARRHQGRSPPFCMHPYFGVQLLGKDAYAEFKAWRRATGRDF